MTGLRWSLEVMTREELDELLDVYLKDAPVSYCATDADSPLGAFHHRALMLRQAMQGEQAAADTAGEDATFGQRGPAG